MDVLTGLTLVTAAQAIVAGVIVIADLIPAPRRPAPDYDGQVTWTDTTGSIPTVRYLPDVEIDLDRRRTRSAAEEQIRRRAGLQRHLAALLSAVDDVREQLRDNRDAETRPVPVLDEQPTGGER